MKITQNKNRKHIKNINNNKSWLHHVCFHWGLFNELKFLKKKGKKKGCFAPLCVPLGLKKPGDFTLSEGIRVQIFRFFGGWVWSEGKKKGRHGRNVSDRHGHPLVGLKSVVRKKIRRCCKIGGGVICSYFWKYNLYSWNVLLLIRISLPLPCITPH